METAVQKRMGETEYLALYPKYRRETSALIKWLHANTRMLDTESIGDYLAFLKDCGYAPRSFNLKLTAIKESLRWVFDQSTDSMDMGKKMQLEAFLKTLKPYKIQSIAISDDKVLSREEVDLLRASVSPRLGIIISFLYHTGLRISEMTGIRLEDIRENGACDYIQVLGKGNKIREIKCRRELMDQVRDEFNGSIYLFESEVWRQGNEGGRPLSRHNVSKAITKAGFKYLDREISAHTFRHSFATRLIGEGKNIKGVSGYLGHSSVKTTLDLYVHDSLELGDLPV